MNLKLWAPMAFVIKKRHKWLYVEWRFFSRTFLPLLLKRSRQPVIARTCWYPGALYIITYLTLTYPNKLSLRVFVFLARCVWRYFQKSSNEISNTPPTQFSLHFNRNCIFFCSKRAVPPLFHARSTSFSRVLLARGSSELRMPHDTTSAERVLVYEVFN